VDAEFRLIEVPSGADLAGPAAWMLAGMADVERADKLAVFGQADLARTEHQLAGEWADCRYSRKRWVVATHVDAPTRVVGMARLELPTSGNTHLADLMLVVDPGWRRGGLGGRLLDWAEATALQAGRTTLLTYIDAGVPLEGGPVLSAPEGGTLAGDLPGVALARDRGYRLEQVERLTVLDVPVGADALARAEAQVAAPLVGYELHTWVDGIPTEWHGRYADLVAEFLAAAPMAGIAVETEPWDADRLRAHLDSVRRQGLTLIVTAAEHVASGRLVASSDLAGHPRGLDAAMQGMTLVLAGHRGHRLGMRVKLANLRTLARVRPDVRRIHTGNAAENAPMLAINDTLGFRDEGVAATFQRRLAAPDVAVTR